MSNVLGDTTRQQILALGRLGWTLSRIEQTTGFRRETISGYLKAAGIPVRGRGRPSESRAKPAISPPSVSTDRGPKPAISGAVSTDSDGATPATRAEVSTDSAAVPRPGRAPSGSACEPYRELILEERVRFTIDHAVALQDGRASNRLCQVALARARGAEKEHVLPLGDEARGGQLVDERPVHLLVEVKVKGVERALGVTETRQLVPALELIMRRYERASTLLTSNRPVDDWGKLLGDTAAVTALLDRLLHHAHVLKCGPRSWRTNVQTDLHTDEGTK